MLKKALICFGSAVGLLVLCLLLFVYKGGDEVTFFQRQNINQYLSAVPFEQDAGGNNIIMPVAVASGTDGYPCDTFLGARNQIDYATGYVEVKVAVTPENEVILAEGYTAYDEEKSVRLSRVINQLAQEYDEFGVVIELSEYSRLSYLNAVLVNREVVTKSVITGVHENAVSYVKSFFPQTKVLCDYNGENRLSLAEIRASGADGILCAGEVFNSSLAEKAREEGLLVWVDCDSDVYATVKAMKFGADGIVSDRPGFVADMRMWWSADAFEEAVKNSKE
ncbi:MAG: hypothetical protein IKK49_09260 [Clostridia bacterium]|nr:hypothetical protein [Clostridia bacterium]